MGVIIIIARTSLYEHGASPRARRAAHVSWAIDATRRCVVAQNTSEYLMLIVEDSDACTTATHGSAGRSVHVLCCSSLTARWQARKTLPKHSIFQHVDTHKVAGATAACAQRKMQHLTTAQERVNLFRSGEVAKDL